MGFCLILSLKELYNHLGVLGAKTRTTNPVKCCKHKKITCHSRHSQLLNGFYFDTIDSFAGTVAERTFCFLG